ncbi:methyltransferase domain-containing protein [Haloquadratum walsbyi]|uniref:tRNA(1-methyladenosine) methyltransferase related protein n=1 Tax=Haloquadratum walsbyi J07HQW2 TaxID=1238425 RepID=U1MVW6_9EURY|nr:methyltransferase domain-containing protein [Haloquadratum walsbyi]ERG94559.1 MAG: tRNA(1-methyladenosine) methyltransferase related protein [Haloquadratum walsbyi J07HQW2]
MTTSSSYLLVNNEHDREYLRAAGEELQTDLGVLEVPVDVDPGDVIETHLDVPFTVRQLRGPDLFNHFERTGAPMIPRDIGLLIGQTGVAHGDRVLDAGTGTGVLAAYLGRLGVDVTSYEIDSEFADVARENMSLAGVADQVEIRTGDLTAALDTVGDEEPFDVLTLDTADAPTIIEAAQTLLAPGGYIAVYVPFVEHTREAVEAARKAGVTAIETYETIQREMDFDERGSRPSTAGVGHTGYMTIGRTE